MKTLKTHSHSMNNPSRRSVLGGLAAATFMALPGQAIALSTSKAETLITRVVKEVLSIVNAGSSDAAKIRKFEAMFRQYGDVEVTARSLLGPAWRSASAADRKAYVNALAGYLSRKYGKRFREFRGGEITIVKSTDFGNKGVLVETRVSTAEHRPFPVEWQVVEKDGKAFFFDIIIEGIRLVSTEKTEIRALLAKNGGDVAKLAAHLKRLG